MQTSNMDKQYWNEFYKKHSARKNISNCSTFASFCCKNFFTKRYSIVDLGCGNARDSIHFAKQGHDVLAVDQSLETCVTGNNTHKNLQYLNDDFIRPSHHQRGLETTEYHPDLLPVDVFYSRFTMHSITEREQEDLLNKVYTCLREKGLFCIEVRTTKDPKFGVGKHICDTTYLNDGHNRRFIDSHEFLKRVLSLGFKLRYFNEQGDLSIYKDDNPVLMRVILEK